LFCGSSYRDCTTAATLVNRDAIVVLKTACLKGRGFYPIYRQ
jgi:hypothetical protein